MSEPQWVTILRAKPYVRPAEWIRLSGEAPSSVYDALESGHLPSIRLGERGLAIPTVPLLALLGVTPDNDESRPCEGRPVASDCSPTPDASTARKVSNDVTTA